MAGQLMVAPIAGVEAEHLPARSVPVATAHNKQPGTLPLRNDNYYRGVDTWVTNEIDGYWTGSFYAKRGDKFTKLATDSRPHLGEYSYGEVTYPEGSKIRSMCGWISDKNKTVADTPLTPDPNNPCTGKEAELKDRDAFGHDFNCAPHACSDGTRWGATHIREGCDPELYSLEVEPKSRDALREDKDTYLGDQPGPIHYRYTLNNSKMAVVRSEVHGWLMVAKNCLTGSFKDGPSKADGIRWRAQKWAREAAAK